MSTKGDDEYKKKLLTFFKPSLVPSTNRNAIKKGGYVHKFNLDLVESQFKNESETFMVDKKPLIYDQVKSKYNMTGASQEELKTLHGLDITNNGAVSSFIKTRNKNRKIPKNNEKSNNNKKSKNQKSKKNKKPMVPDLCTMFPSLTKNIFNNNNNTTTFNDNPYLNTPYAINTKTTVASTAIKSGATAGFVFNKHKQRKDKIGDNKKRLEIRHKQHQKNPIVTPRSYITNIDGDEERKQNEIIWRGNNKKKHSKQNNDDNTSENVTKKLYIRSRNWREKSLVEMTTTDWETLKEEFHISTKFQGQRLPNPIRFWNEASLPKPLLSAIHSVAAYAEPYGIQRMIIPVALSNRDCVGIAETGSGKTAAFVLPILVYIYGQPPINHLNFEDGPYSIILTPTRELAKQIESEINKLATYCSISAITIVGGINRGTQSNLLRNGTHVIIATPGALLDCIDTKILVLNQCKYIVLDDVDKMINMGLESQVNAIFERIENIENNINKVCRQICMFSATMTSEFDILIQKYLRNPVTIVISHSANVMNDASHLYYNEEKTIDITSYENTSTRSIYPMHPIKQPMTLNQMDKEHYKYQPICDEIQNEIDTNTTPVIDGIYRRRKNWSERSRINKEKAQQRARASTLRGPLVFDYSEYHLDTPSPRKQNGYLKTGLIYKKIYSQVNDSSKFKSK